MSRGEYIVPSITAITATAPAAIAFNITANAITQITPFRMITTAIATVVVMTRSVCVGTIATSSMLNDEVHRAQAFDGRSIAACDEKQELLLLLQLYTVDILPKLPNQRMGVH